MRSRLIALSLLFPLSLTYTRAEEGATVSQASATFTLPTHTELDRLPMDGGWTYGELLEKAKKRDRQANILLGEFWMGLYYLNRGDLPLSCLDRMNSFFGAAIDSLSGNERESKEAALRMMMTDPYGIFGIFRTGSCRLPQHEAWIQTCRTAAEKGDIDAITALYTTANLTEGELKKLIAPLFRKAKESGNEEQLAQYLHIRSEWFKEDPESLLKEARLLKKDPGSALLYTMGLLEQRLAHAHEGALPISPSLVAAAVQGHAGALRALTLQSLPDNQTSPNTQTPDNGQNDAIKSTPSLLTAVLYEQNSQAQAKETDGRKLSGAFQISDIYNYLIRRGGLQDYLDQLVITQDYRKSGESGIPDFSAAETLTPELLPAILHDLSELGTNEDAPSIALVTHASLLSADNSKNVNDLNQIGERLLKRLDERALLFTKFNISPPRNYINKLPSIAKTHKELELAAEMGDADACICLAEWWRDEREQQSSEAKRHEAEVNMRIWYEKAAELEHPLAALRLDELNKNDAPASQDKWQACLSKAQEGDFMTLLALSPNVRPEQWQELLQQLREKAKAGDSLSQANLAYLLLFSYQSQESDIQEGLAWAKLSSEKGDCCGLYVLGRALVCDFGVERQKEGDSYLFRAALAGHCEAASLWQSELRDFACTDDNDIIRELAERGHLPSLLTIAHRLAYPDSDQFSSNGEAGPSDPADQKGNFRKTQNPEDEEIPADAIPPWMNEHGKEHVLRSTPTLNQEAIKLWNQAAALGSLTALDEIAGYCEDVAQQTKDESEKQRILASALSAATTLAEKKDIRGFKRMARYYDQGIGVQKNEALARDYIRKAAATNDPEALIDKARMLVKGDKANQNPKEAFAILSGLEESASEPFPGLYFLLGYLYEEGLGTNKDSTKAYQCYLKAADQDDDKAMNNLGSMFEIGNGVDQSIDEAIKWYSRAAKCGNEDGKANFERLKAKKSSAEKSKS